MPNQEQNQYHIRLAAKGCPTLTPAVSDSIAASEALCQYRDGYGIGASDMKRGFGDVTDATGKVIARVSYNGRAWNPDGSEMRIQPFSLSGGAQ